MCWDFVTSGSLYSIISLSLSLTHTHTHTHTHTYTNRSYKILLIGESSVGKTTIATRLCEERFMSETRQHTLGSYHCKQ